ncbi:MAG: iron-sulfur cluster assembly accessory protein [Candidatus Binatia bacterium]
MTTEPQSAAVTFEPIVLTADAVNKVRSAMKKEGAGPEKALRLGVVGGGCSGFSYTMGFDEPKSDDSVYTFEDVRVVIDAASHEYLDGTIIDYVTGLHGAGFKFENPKATRTCGCGSSFSA